MLTNYFKLAIKVLARHKSFTFISLFGISFTLMVLMLLTAFLETELGSNPPVSNKDKMLYVPDVTLKNMRIDTIINIDTTYVNGIMQLDSTIQEKERQQSFSRSSISYFLLDTYLREFDGADNYTFFTPDAIFDVFVHGKKLSLTTNYTDERFWQIFDFPFLEGKGFEKNAVENKEQVAVISKDLAEKYYGHTKNIVGEFIKFDKKQFKIVGLIDDVPNSTDYLNQDIYIPFTHQLERKLSDKTKSLGGFNAVYLCNSPQNRKALKSEIEAKVRHIPFPETKRFNRMNLGILTFEEMFADKINPTDNPKKAKTILSTILIILIAFFLALPTLNLININVTRIAERASEIGVRKAFGAHSGTILIQFVFENILLTFLGAAIGLIGAILAIYFINECNILANTQLIFNYMVFFYSVFITLFFGILSGLLPAYRMSKLSIISALKM